MTLKETVKSALDKIQFAERYIELCNGFKDYDDGKSFKKNEVQEVLKRNGFTGNYASSDKSFFTDYVKSGTAVRHTLTYKRGFIECFYSFQNEETKERVIGRFNSIAKMEDENFDDQVLHKFPIATSLEDLEKILAELLQLHNDFMEQFEKVAN